VIHKTDSDSEKLVVELGEDARLFCKTNFPWKKCFWRPPRSGVKQVQLSYEMGPYPTRPERTFDPQ